MSDISFPRSNLRTEVTGSDLDDLDDEYYDTSDDSEAKDGDDNDFNIDDGLLDSVFDELPGTGQTRPPPPSIRPVSRPSPGYIQPPMIIYIFITWCFRRLPYLSIIS